MDCYGHFVTRAGSEVRIGSEIHASIGRIAKPPSTPLCPSSKSTFGVVMLSQKFLVFSTAPEA